jgi:hypothetical protein
MITTSRAARAAINIAAGETTNRAAGAATSTPGEDYN